MTDMSFVIGAGVEFKAPSNTI